MRAREAESKVLLPVGEGSAGVEPKVIGEEVQDEVLEAAGVRLWLKRDDLIHGEVSGNKWRKLKYNLVAAGAEGSGCLLTFGGAYSNHVRATAAAGPGLGG